MRLLLVRLGAFGDLLHTLPLAADLAAAGHAVGWVCEDRWAPVLEGSPAVTRVHRLPRRTLRDRQLPWTTRLAAAGGFLHELRGAQYDLVIDAQGLAKSALLARTLGIPVLGHDRPRARELAWAFADRRIRTSAVHVIDQQRDLARGLGLTPTGPWRFPLPAWTAERSRMGSWLTERGLARPWMLNVGAGWPTKVWPEARQTAFLTALGRLQRPIVVVWGSAEERQVAERLIAAAGHGVLAPPTSLPELTALLEQAAVVISGDTGPLHAARAVNTPAVGLFGPVPGERNGPRGPGTRVLQAPGAAWERRDVTKVDMGALDEQAVIAAAEACLDEHLRTSACIV
jgi:heptosyltransferase-1